MSDAGRLSAPWCLYFQLACILLALLAWLLKSRGMQVVIETLMTACLFIYGVVWRYLWYMRSMIGLRFWLLIHPLPPRCFCFSPRLLSNFQYEGPGQESDGNPFYFWVKIQAAQSHQLDSGQFPYTKKTPSRAIPQLPLKKDIYKLGYTTSKSIRNKLRDSYSSIFQRIRYLEESQFQPL